MNESIIALPPNIEDTQVLKRFLQNLIVKLDEVLGYRGDDASIRASDLLSVTESTGVTFTSITEQLVALQEQVDAVVLTAESLDTDTAAQLEELDARITELENWRVTAQAELDDHETRITTLEGLHP